jgi:arabinosaccharide transport system substrate-binding protein
MNFPYGKAPLAVLLVALICGLGLALGPSSVSNQRKPDLIYASFASEHIDAYRSMVPAFEKQNDVDIQLELVDQLALQDRLQSALQVGADVPDMVELLYNTMGIFTIGPIDNVGFVDLTNRVHSSGLYDQLVSNRFTKWSSRGHIFALPNDMHPVMLAYRRDMVEALGIDVNALTTWDKFVAVGRDLQGKHLPGDRVAHHYMIDLTYDGNDILRLLLLKHGAGLFDASGHVAFDNDAAVDVICWYVKQIQGEHQIAYACGTGQAFDEALLDGLCLFYMCPDWRTKQIQNDVPSLSGKMGLIPLPAWEPGGVRTSTWGGTGLAITKQCKNVDLAWKLAMYLYYNPTQLAENFSKTNILPPLKSAWNLPVFDRHSAFWSDLPLGRVYAQLAPQVPQEYDTAYTNMANPKLSEAFGNALIYYSQHGDDGLRAYTASELKRCADLVRKAMARNKFIAEDGQ